MKASKRRCRSTAFTAISLVALFLLASNRAWCAPNASQERLQQWIAAKFDATSRSAPAAWLLPRLGSGVIEKRSRKGFPLRIGGQEFARGMHASAMGTIEVHLPGNATAFDAMVGVDSNDLTYYSSRERGRVVVVVESHGKELFRSQTLTEGMAAVAVHVPLQGDIFTLRLEGAKEDTMFNQVTFGDARVTLAQGGSAMLDDFPVGPLAPPPDTELPFSFVYGGASSRQILSAWKHAHSTRRIDAARTELTHTYLDPASHLEVRLVATVYQDFPTVEWTLYFKNNGSQETPILENIQALDTRFQRNGEGEFLLHHSKGAPATANDYQPYETTLAPNEEKQLSAFGGRPTNKDLSYFNVEWPGQGIVLSVGWPGQWASTIKRDSGTGLIIRAGQELTHFKLLPGEEVRSPLIVLQFWDGVWIDAQNTWRRWMLAHNIPRLDGKLPPPQMAANTSREFLEMIEATEKDEKEFIDLYKRAGLDPDYFWMDAGWYKSDGTWVNTGTWEVDTKRFPNGLRAVSDHGRAQGVKTIVWFEPERVTKGSWLYENHPEWLLQAAQPPGNQLYDKEWRLLNLGEPEALHWLIEHVDKLINEQGIDLYRQDFNMDPLNFWRSHDAPDRQGITEIRYVTGYLAYWDALRKRHPGMLIDSCASGGRRNDVETLRRAVPLTRSDYLMEPAEPISQQTQTQGMALWIPYFGTGISGSDDYTFRSQMTAAIVTSWDLRRKDTDIASIRKLVGQWRSIAGDYLGDFYPLTAWSLEKDVWGAMQFNQHAGEHGFVISYRRSRSAYQKAVFPLHGLKPTGKYETVEQNTGERQVHTGDELMKTGLSVELTSAPASSLVVYKLIDSR